MIVLLVLIRSHVWLKWNFKKNSWIDWFAFWILKNPCNESFVVVFNLGNICIPFEHFSINFRLIIIFVSIIYSLCVKLKSRISEFWNMSTCNHAIPCGVFVGLINSLLTKYVLQEYNFHTAFVCCPEYKWNNCHWIWCKRHSIY